LTLESHTTYKTLDVSESEIIEERFKGGEETEKINAHHTPETSHVKNFYNLSF